MNYNSYIPIYGGESLFPDYAVGDDTIYAEPSYNPLVIEYPKDWNTVKDGNLENVYITKSKDDFDSTIIDIYYRVFNPEGLKVADEDFSNYNPNNIFEHGPGTKIELYLNPRNLTYPLTNLFNKEVVLNIQITGKYYDKTFSDKVLSYKPTVNYKITNNILVVPSKGTGNSVIQVLCAPNDTTNSKNTTLTVSTNTLSKQCIVTQKPGEEKLTINGYYFQDYRIGNAGAHLVVFYTNKNVEEDILIKYRIHTNKDSVYNKTILISKGKSYNNPINTDATGTPYIKSVEIVSADYNSSGTYPKINIGIMHPITLYSGTESTTNKIGLCVVNNKGVVSGANIVGKGTQIGGTTDINGWYLVDPIKYQTVTDIEISHDGYAHRSITKSAYAVNKNHLIYLYPENMPPIASEFYIDKIINSETSSSSLTGILSKNGVYSLGFGTPNINTPDIIKDNIKVNENNEYVVNKAIPFTKNTIYNIASKVSTSDDIISNYYRSLITISIYKASDTSMSSPVYTHTSTVTTAYSSLGRFYPEYREHYNIVVETEDSFNYDFIHALTESIPESSALTITGPIDVNNTLEYYGIIDYAVVEDLALNMGKRLHKTPPTYDMYPGKDPELLIPLTVTHAAFVFENIFGPDIQNDPKVENAVIDTIKSQLGIDTVNLTDTFNKLGGDSMDMVEVGIQIEDTLGEIPDTVYEGINIHSTIQEIITAIQNYLNSK